MRFSSDQYRSDASSQKTSTVGIAMGAALALETADVSLMADRLDQLPSQLN